MTLSSDDVARALRVMMDVSNGVAELLLDVNDLANRRVRSLGDTGSGFGYAYGNAYARDGLRYRAEGASMPAADFSKADLADADMSDGSFLRAKFIDSDLDSTDFTDTDLKDAHFRRIY